MAAQEEVRLCFNYIVFMRILKTLSAKLSNVAKGKTNFAFIYKQKGSQNTFGSLLLYLY
jgi:hypothetical protein